MALRMHDIFIRVKQLLTATAVILALVLESIAFACPDSARMRAPLFFDAAASEMGEQEPCSDAKEEICASVRDSMVSIRAPDFRVDRPAHHSFWSPPIKTESLAGGEIFYSVFFLNASYHRAFKIPLRYAYSVFRI
jgi:hypothetical protein